MWNDRTHASAGAICLPIPNPRKGRILFAPFEASSGDDARCSWCRAHARHRPGNALIDTEYQNTQHGSQGGQPSLNPVMGVSPWPLSLPPNSARANKSFHALHGDWAESVLGAETHGGNAASRGLEPVAQRTPAALKYGTCSTEISGGKRSRAGGECCHSGSSSCVSPRPGLSEA